MAKKSFIYKDDLGYHTKEETIGSPQEVQSLLNLNPGPPPKRDTGGLVVRDIPTRTPQQLEKLAKKNADNLKKPITKLGKKGDTFYDSQIKYLICERTEKFMFLECWIMLRNPDGSIPSIPDSKREVGYHYWQACPVVVHVDPVLDGFDYPTGEKTEKREHILPSPNIEIRKTDAEFRLISGSAGLGFNADKELVYQSYLDAVSKYESDVRNVAAREAQKKQQAADALAKNLKLIEYKGLHMKALGELKTIMRNGKSIESILKDKKSLALLDEFTRLESLSKLL